MRTEMKRETRCYQKIGRKANKMTKYLALKVEKKWFNTKQAKINARIMRGKKSLEKCKRVIASIAFRFFTLNPYGENSTLSH